MTRKTYIALALVILLLGGGLRFYRIAERSLWLDEARVANYARQSFSNNITKTRLGSSSPITFPLILQAVQRTHDSAFAIRSTAAAFSLLAILAVLALPGLGFDRIAALVSASVLAVSPSQVRYAQEVREYSLSVLLASLLLLSLVAVTNQRRRARTLVVITVFMAPLVQYGLVFLSVSLFFALLLEGRSRCETRNAVRLVVQAVAALAIGTCITYVLTLGDQLSRDMPYLNRHYFHGSMADFDALFTFLFNRGLHLAEYLLIGNGTIICAILVAGGFLLSRSSAPRDTRCVFVFALVSVATIAAVSVIGVYPFGGIRQNLILAPLVATALGASWAAFCAALPERARLPVAVASIAVILATGTHAVVEANPYKEKQDIKSVIRALERRQPGDLVFVHYGSGPAMSYYRVDGPEFVYGSHNRDTPDAVLPEFRRLVGDGTSRVWVVFTHASRAEKRQLLDGLSREWRFTPVVKAPGARLFLGHRIADGSKGRQPGRQHAYGHR